MDMALRLAARGLGRVWPNPAVGCVLVQGRHVIGRGWTQAGGRPHAETEALRRAGPAARGATAYVSLEPCCHHGRTAPCTDALIAAGVSRVVAAVRDPDPRVSGSGLERLAQAGVAVRSGVRQEEAEALNAGFFSRVRRGRPLITVKLATTLDGRIATASGDSRWITGPAARARAHLLRARHDAVLVGSGTALSDDPELTCRLPGLAQPVRIVLDGQGRLPPSARLLTAAGGPVWLLTAADKADALAAHRRAGATVLPVERASAEGIDLPRAMQLLGKEGLTSVLVEGGGRLAAALLRAGLVDRLCWFHAPALLGADARAAIGPLGLAAIAAMPRLRRLEAVPIGEDLLETYAVTA